MPRRIGRLTQIDKQADVVTTRRVELANHDLPAPGSRSPMNPTPAVARPPIAQPVKIDFHPGLVAAVPAELPGRCAGPVAFRPASTAPIAARRSVSSGQIDQSADVAPAPTAQRSKPHRAKPIAAANRRAAFVGQPARRPRRQMRNAPPAPVHCDAGRAGPS